MSFIDLIINKIKQIWCVHYYEKAQFIDFLDSKGGVYFVCSKCGKTKRL